MQFADVKISAVFDGGSRTERSAIAEVIATDPARDLAVLKVAGLKGRPVPVEYARPVTPAETMPVYTLGFPFGQSATSSGSPAITVGKPSISSVRLDDNGDVALSRSTAASIRATAAVR